jgi:hypothetical protein
MSAALALTVIVPLATVPTAGAVTDTASGELNMENSSMMSSLLSYPP